MQKGSEIEFSSLILFDSCGDLLLVPLSPAVKKKQIALKFLRKQGDRALSIKLQTFA